MSFTTSVRVRFGDEDHARIVFYPRYFEFFHDAFEDFFDQQGHPYKRVLDEEMVGWPTVRVETDFRGPLRFSDVVNIEISVSRLGTKSAVFDYRATKVGDAHPCAVASITVACMDLNTYRAIPIPEKYREFFAQHLNPTKAV